MLNFSFPFLFLLCVFSPGYMSPIGIMHPKIIFSMAGIFFLLRKKSIEKEVFYFLFSFCIVVFVFFIHLAVSKNLYGYDEIFFLLVKGIIVPYLCAVFFYENKPDNISADEWFYQLIQGSIIMGFLFILAELLIPGVQEWYLSIISLADEWRQFVTLLPLRGLGVAGLSVYDSSIAIAMMGIYVIPRMIVKKSNVFLILIMMIALVIQCGLFGRSGLMLLLAAYFVFLFNSGRLYKRVTFIFISVMLVLGLFFYHFVDNNAIKFALEIFINLSEGKGLHSDSTDDLIDNHLFIPSLDGFWGSGVWDPSGILFPQYKTDSGILLALIAGGPVFLGLVFWFTYKFYGLLKRDFSFFNVKKYSLLNFFSIVVACVFSVFFIVKAPIYISSPIMTLFIFKWKFNRASIN